ncbi:hypothetical protein Cgig2_002015 [Carnegiea gigantea]|uniref:CHY-type domain-containing protein n=1 Tax=Carnegiea gigantea TaxID=171969 RepID=A0A9Q1JR08_9CARY|nr:hypothetical protein Cgig2_002015 [Carnegiea gigantea]
MEATLKQSELSQNLEPNTLQQEALNTVHSALKCSEDAINDVNDVRDKGYMKYGCQHYRRRCRIRAPCCGEVFDCRHCHNEAMNNIKVDTAKRHDIPRHEVQQVNLVLQIVICSLCGTEQETSKKQYHCEGCGICRYACPLCSKSVCDMSKVWEKFDMEIASTPMPEPYQNKMVSILCNDCGAKSNVQFHIVAQKCPNCKSYNTRQMRG